MKAVWPSLALVSLALAPMHVLAAEAKAKSVDDGLTVAVTAGALDFALPARQTGVFSTGNGTFNPTDSAGVIGGQLGVSVNKDIGSYNDLDLALGLNAFIDYAHGSSAVTDTFSGPGVVVIPGYTTPANTSITLSTNGASTTNPASATVVHTAPGSETEAVDAHTNPAGTIDSYGATTSAPDSFAMGAITSIHGGPDAAGAYGAVGATDGGIFIGSGDLTGLKITTTSTTDLIYTGMDATISASGKPEDGKVLQVYGGPSYRFMNNHTATDTAVDIPEVASADPSNYFPIYKMDRDETISSHYVGGIVGLNSIQPLPNGMTLALNGEAGVYYTLSSLKGSESYSLVGGTVNPSIPLTTIQNANGVDQSANALAYAARIGSSVSMPIANNSMQLTLGANVEYLSRVAYATRSGGASNVTSSAAPYGVTSDNGTTTYNGASSGNTLIAFGDMWNFGVNASLTGHF